MGNATGSRTGASVNARGCGRWRAVREWKHVFLRRALVSDGEERPLPVKHGKGAPIIDVYARTRNGVNGVTLPMLHYLANRSQWSPVLDRTQRRAAPCGPCHVLR